MCTNMNNTRFAFDSLYHGTTLFLIKIDDRHGFEKIQRSLDLPNVATYIYLADEFSTTNSHFMSVHL